MSSRSAASGRSQALPPRRASARFFIIRGAVVLLFFLLGSRLVYVQAVMGPDLQKKAARQRAVRERTESVRHRILDRNGLVLCESVRVQSCFADPSLIKNPDSVARILANAFNLDSKAVLRKLRSTKGSFVWIKRNVPPAAVAILKEKKIPGIGFKAESRRHHPQGDIASHLLGLVGYENKGLSGMEQAFDKSLSGAGPTSTVIGEPVPVGDLQLTIDAGIQKLVERELEWGAKKIHAKRGTVIVQDPASGDILALASWPTVSLNPDDPPSSGELKIPALSDVFEPGSTFKVVVGAAALEEKVVSMTETFDGEKGKWKVMGITIHDHEPRHRMNFDDIIVYSSNIGTGKLADRLGSDRLYQYARLFGFGVYPGSGLSAEARGTLRPLSKWSGVSKYAVSFGQEVGVTALQMTNAYSAIANGGTLMEPRLVHASVDDDGDPVWVAQMAAVRRVISPETAKRLTETLVKVVDLGTGVSAKIQWDPRTKVAGKTGTAQKFDNERKRYHETKTLISFCGFFPAEQPQYVMMVMLDEPEGRRWGGLDAAPVFRRIAENLSPRLTAERTSARERSPG